MTAEERKSPNSSIKSISEMDSAEQVTLLLPHQAPSKISDQSRKMRFHLYFTSCVLLLSLNSRTSTGLPLPQSANDDALCASLFKILLTNITGLLKTEILCQGLIAASDVVVPSPETVQACAPTMTQNSSCMMQRNSSFSESDCRSSIMRDLAYYDAAIQSYLQSQLHMPEQEKPPLHSTLRVIQNLRDNCSTTANGGKDSSEKEAATLWSGDSFTNRQKMCKMMRGFQVRAITINRAMGYISSGDHRK